MTAILAITGIFRLFMFLFAFNAADVDALVIGARSYQYFKQHR